MIGMMNTPVTVTVVGGGNSAHVLIPFLDECGHRVNLLTRRPNDWDDTIICDVYDKDNKISSHHEGTIHRKSMNPADVIPESDIIILCMPVHQYRNALWQLAPHVNKNKEVFIGTIYGQAGFNWMVHEIEREFQLPNVVAFAIGLIPWICRTTKYGSTVANYGGKKVNIVAITPAHKFQQLEEMLLDDLSYRPLGIGKFAQADTFLDLTMSVDNQIVHPGRCYGLWKRYGGKWSSMKEVPYFYRDFDDVSADNMFQLDREYELIRDAIRKRFPDRNFKYMLGYLDLERLSHESANVDIKASLKESAQLAQIKTPTVPVKEGDEEGERMLNVQMRFFTDDIPYGVLLAKWIGEQLGVKTAFLDEIIIWAQNLRGEHFLDEKTGKIDKEYCLSAKFTSGIPESYGIASVEGILD